MNRVETESDIQLAIVLEVALYSVSLTFSFFTSSLKTILNTAQPGVLMEGVEDVLDVRVR